MAANHRIIFEKKKNGVLIRASLSEDFKERLDQKECIQCLKLPYDDEAPSYTTVFRWFTEFCRGQNSLLNEKYTERTFLAVLPEIVLIIQKILIDDNRCIYQMI